MPEPSSSAVFAMCQKMSDRSWVFSILKFGLYLLKYSSLMFLTRLESWPNASRQLHVNALYRDVISHHLELGGPSGVALDVVLPRCTGSGEGCCHLGLGEHSGAGGEGFMGAGTCPEGEASCERLNGRDISTCPINTW